MIKILNSRNNRVMFFKNHENCYSKSKKMVKNLKILLNDFYLKKCLKRCKIRYFYYFLSFYVF